MSETFDAIVIGAGAMGSAAAYYLSRRGQKTLLLEQFELDHRKGSSYGYSRIIRYAYDHPEYVELAQDAYPLWFALQDELGQTLYIKTGGIDFGPADDAMLQATIAAVKSSGIAHELLSVEAAHRRFPQFRFNDDFLILHQPDSGLISASQAVLGHIRLAQRYGAAVQAQTPVQRIAIHPDSVELTTAAGTYSAARLIVTGGAWAKSLLQPTGIDLPLQPLRCQLNFMATGDLSGYDTASCPVWIAHVSRLFPNTLYGLPAHQQTGFKAAYHSGAPIDHPAQVDYDPDPENTASLRNFLAAHIPALAAAPLLESRICLYTNTPDEHFIIDAHPAHPHIAIGAGFSGHGFKFSTLIGKMLSEIALDGATAHNSSLFKLSRFTG